MTSAGAPPEPEFTRLFPQAGTVTATQALDELDPVGAAGCERPYTLVNFVVSADGRAAVKGRSAPLSDPGDRAIFHGLRERVDAVFAGPATMGSERYGRMVRDPERRRRRAARGLSPDPLAVTLSRSGAIPTDIPLFDDPHSRVVVFAPESPDLRAVAAEVDSVALDPGELTLTTMMRRLRADYDVRALLCEGGPTVFSGMLEEDLVDELFLTISPMLVGAGTDPTLTSGAALPEVRNLRLVWVLERESTLFVRYARD